VGLIHGRMDAETKDRVMHEFRCGTLSVLVSTTVIEVGVDVPNATIMLIEEAGRFGLAQMHQLRGRIGRGTHRSWCILMHDGKNAQSLEKLRILEQSNNGFEIAEADLRLRGPGDLMGSAQTGLPDFGPGDLVRDGDLMSEARQTAQKILTDDPDLALPLHASMRAYVKKNQIAAELSDS
jgi:ATP-dependent DNA helicase RecG